MNLNSLRKTLLICGVVMLLIAMFANVNLYLSLASTPIDRLTWGALGLVFDVVKITSLIVCGILWTVFNRPFAALLAFLAWLTLTGLSLSTLFGYTSKVTQETERQAAINSLSYKSAQAALESSGQRLGSLSGYANLDSAALQSQLDVLLRKRSAYEAELSACPRDYVTKCIKPAQAKLQAVAAEIVPIQRQMDGYNQYQGVVASKDRALNDSKTALLGGASVEVLHPMFTNGATLLNDVFGLQTTPAKLKVWFLALSATLCELLASFVLFLVAIMGGRDFHSIDGIESLPIKAMPSSPRRSDGGAVMAGEEKVATPKS